jgi:hypothetical protein
MWDVIFQSIKYEIALQFFLILFGKNGDELKSFPAIFRIFKLFSQSWWKNQISIETFNWNTESNLIKKFGFSVKILWLFQISGLKNQTMKTKSLEKKSSSNRYLIIIIFHNEILMNKKLDFEWKKGKFLFRLPFGFSWNLI